MALRDVLHIDVFTFKASITLNEKVDTHTQAKCSDDNKNDCIYIVHYMKAFNSPGATAWEGGEPKTLRSHPSGCPSPHIKELSP